jgi:hypothetical protein
MWASRHGRSGGVVRRRIRASLCLLTVASVMLVSHVPPVNATNSSASGEVAPDELVAHLPFDETGGRVAADVAGMGNDGSLTKSTTFDPAGGRHAGAVVLSGVDTRVTIASTPTINDMTVQRRTVAVWFMASDVTIATRKQVLWEEGGSSKGLAIYLFDGRLYVGGKNGSRPTNWGGTFLSTGAIESGRWHHVALVLDGSEQIAPEALRGYLDGAPFDSGSGAQVDAHSGIGIGAVNGSATFHDETSSSANGLDGRIDELLVFNRVLSDHEVALLAAGGIVEPPENRAPVAEAGQDRTVAPGTTVQLDGSGSSDPDGGPQPLSYSWVQLSGTTVSISDDSSAVASATLSAVGTYVFRLTVSDGDLQASDEVTFTVIEPPPPGSGPAVVPNTDLSNLTSDKGEWNTNNQRRSWWNSHRQRWDAFLPAAAPPASSASAWWLVKGVDHASPTFALQFHANPGIRPDVYWDDAERKLYVLGARKSGSVVSTYSYDASSDIYTVDVANAPIDGADAGNRATIYRTPNGYLWTSMMKSGTDFGLWINRSRDDGRTWDGPVRLMESNNGGQTSLTHFTQGGTTYLAVAAAEDGKAENSRFLFLAIEQGDNNWDVPAAWQDESPLIPPFQGAEHADDEISVTRDRAGNVYIVAETEPGSGSNKAGDPQLVLFKRSISGDWSQVTVTRFASSVKSRKRPTVVIDGSTETLYVFHLNADKSEVSYSYAPLSDIERLATSPMTVIFQEAGKQFRNNVTPRFETTADSGLLVLVDNLTDGTIWQHRLAAPGNQAPVADAGLDRTVLPGTTVQLDGSGSYDPDGRPQPLSYSWEQASGPAVSLQNATSRIASATLSAEGRYVFRLRVSDGELEDSAIVTFTVAPPANVAPVADAGSDRTVEPGATVELDGSGSYDPDDGPLPLTYQWQRVSGPTVTIQNGTSPIATATFAEAGMYVFRLTVDDGDAQAMDEMSVIVSSGDAPPTDDPPPPGDVQPPRVVGVTTYEQVSSGHTSIDAVVPGAARASDLLLVYVHTGNHALEVRPVDPEGWTRLFWNNGGSQRKFGALLWYRVLEEGHPDSYLFEDLGAHRHAVATVAVRNYEPDEPFDSVTWASRYTPEPIVTPGGIADGDDRLALHVASTSRGGGSGLFVFTDPEIEPHWSYRHGTSGRPTYTGGSLRVTAGDVPGAEVFQSSDRSDSYPERVATVVFNPGAAGGSDTSEPWEPPDRAVRMMPLGDSVTAGTGSGTGNTWRYQLHRHLMNHDPDAEHWRMVGPFYGIGDGGTPPVGWASWPQEHARHGALGGHNVRELGAHARDWAAAAQPDVVLAFPGLAGLSGTTEADIEALVTGLREGSQNPIVVLWALPYDSPDNWTTQEWQVFRTRVRNVAGNLGTNAEPVHVIDVATSWSTTFHPHPGGQTRYPRDPEGAERIAVRFADALHDHVGFWPRYQAPVRPELSISGGTTSWAYDNTVDGYEVREPGGTVTQIAPVPGEVQTTSIPDAQVRGYRLPPSGAVNTGEWTYGPWSDT